MTATMKLKKPSQKKMLRIRLSDGKVRELQSMTSTYFYFGGKPVDVEAFLRRLFDTMKLPELFGSEAELRRLWANPVTRRELLKKLAREGFHKDNLEKLQEIIDAEDSDLFDVLEYVAYARPPVSRAARVEANKDNIYNLLDEKQREFVGYILRNYVDTGVNELDISKLDTVLNAKYGGIYAARQELGTDRDIQHTFTGFQQYLYPEAAG